MATYSVRTAERTPFGKRRQIPPTLGQVQFPYPSEIIIMGTHLLSLEDIYLLADMMGIDRASVPDILAQGQVVVAMGITIEAGLIRQWAPSRESLFEWARARAALITTLPIVEPAVVTPTLGNLLTNGSFEVGDPPTGWTAEGSTFSRDATIVKTGSYSGKQVANTTLYSRIIQYIPNFSYYKGRKVSAGLWYYAPSTNDKYGGFRIIDGVGSATDNFIKDSAWHWLALTYTVDINAAYLGVDIINVWGSEDYDDILYTDGVVLVEGEVLPLEVDIEVLQAEKARLQAEVAAKEAEAAVLSQQVILRTAAEEAAITAEKAILGQEIAALRIRLAELTTEIARLRALLV